MYLYISVTIWVKWSQILPQIGDFIKIGPIDLMFLSLGLLQKRLVGVDFTLVTYNFNT